MNGTGAQLIIRYGASAQVEYELTAETITIGREAINEIVVQDPEVSRRHSQISYQDGRHVVQDLGSTNGTFVNGRRITVPTPLNIGDIIEMGETVRITFQSMAGAADATVVRSDPAPAADPGETVADVGGDPGWQAGMPTPQPQYGQQAPSPTSWQTVPQPAATPPPQPAYTGPQESLPPTPQVDQGSNRNRYLIGCGCLAVLAIVACGASVFLLDALAPDFLYCGVAGPVFEAFGFVCP